MGDNMKVRFFRFVMCVVMGALTSTPVRSGGITLINKTCPASGNVAFTTTAPTYAKSFTVQALSGNAASVFVGSSTVTTATGLEIKAGGSIAYLPDGSFGLYNLAAFYIACTTSGSDKITVGYIQ